MSSFPNATFSSSESTAAPLQQSSRSTVSFGPEPRRPTQTGRVPRTALTTEKIKKLDEDIKQVRLHCRKFYATAIKEIKTRFDFTDSVYELAQILEPTKARKPHSLCDLFIRFPSLRNVCDAQKADEEWRDQSKLPPSVFSCETNSEVLCLSPEKYWDTVMKLQVSTLNGSRRRFPNLTKCVALLFTIPTSNVLCERVFSSIKLIKTDRRNSLHSDSVSSLSKIQHFLKNKKENSAHIVFPEDLISYAMKVKASAPISS